MGLVEQQGHEGTRGLQRNKDQEDGIRDLSGLVLVRVEPQVDGAAENLPGKPIRQPVAQGLALIPRLGIGNGDGGLGHPEHAGGEAAERGAQDDEPLCPESVVCVKPGCVGGVSEPGVVSFRAPFDVCLT